MPAVTTIQLRQGTASAWTTANPTLAAGEIGFETDTKKIKVGDGTTAWTSLAYKDLIPANNLSDLASSSTARTNLGLGTAATQASTAFDAAGTATAAVATETTRAEGTETGIGKSQALGNPNAASVTQGLYVRTTPTPDTGHAIYPIVKDPNQNGVNGTGRLWCLGSNSGTIGYTDNDGTTWTSCGIPTIATGGSIVDIVITSAHMYLVVGGTAAQLGQVWRGVAQGATPTTGSTFTSGFTKIFDLTGLVNGPGGSAGNGELNSTLRNQSFAVNAAETDAYILEYGAGSQTFSLGATAADIAMCAGQDMGFSASNLSANGIGPTVGATISIAGAGAAGAALSTSITELWGDGRFRVANACRTTVTGKVGTFGASQILGGSGTCSPNGPAIYVSTNVGTATASSVVWSLGMFFEWARHGHAVKIIGGVPWVSLGDQGWPVPADNKGCAPITQVGLLAATSAAATAFTGIGPASSTNPRDVINFYSVTVGAQTYIVGESDSTAFEGPILYPQSGTTGVQPRPSALLPPPVQGATIALTPLTRTDGTVDFVWLAQAAGASGIGPDAICLMKSPYTRIVVLETMTAGATGGSIYNGVTSNGFFWIGHDRCVIEKFLGQ